MAESLPLGGIFSRRDLTDGLEEQALLGVAWYDGAPDLPPFKMCSRESSCRPPIWADCVAGVAVLGEDGRMRISKNSEGSALGGSEKRRWVGQGSASLVSSRAGGLGRREGDFRNPDSDSCRHPGSEFGSGYRAVASFTVWRRCFRQEEKHPGMVHWVSRGKHEPFGFGSMVLAINRKSAPW